MTGPRRESGPAFDTLNVLAANEDRPRVSFFGVANFLLRNIAMVVGIPVLVSGGAVVVELLDRDYVAESTLLPEGGSGELTAVSGLAAQLGFNVGVGGNGQSLDFYASLLTSRTLLATAATQEYTFPRGKRGADTLSGTLLSVYGLDRQPMERRLSAAVQRLRKDVTVTTDPRSNLLTVRTVAPWPKLAEQLNQHLLQLLNDFNVKQRQSQAAEERLFVEQRASEAQDSLKAAEAQLQMFFENNMSYSESPQLRFRAQRLQRLVDLRQGVYVTLAQSLEKARIEAIRNVPVITVVDPPSGSAHPRRPLSVTAVLGLFFGLALAILVAWLKDYGTRLREIAPTDYDEFVRLRSSFLSRKRAGSPRPETPTQ